MGEPVWKRGDLVLKVRDDHTYISKTNEPPSEFPKIENVRALNGLDIYWPISKRKG